MKKYYFLLFFNVFWLAFSQTKKVVIIEKDSVLFSEIKSESEARFKLDSLVNYGFYTLKIDSVIHKNFTKIYYINKGAYFKVSNIELDSIGRKYIINPENYYDKPERLITSLQEKLSQAGYVFNTIHSFRKIDTLFVKAKIGKKRSVDKILLNSNDRMPKGFIKTLNNIYLEEKYNETLLMSLDEYLNSVKHIELQKNSQVLFLEDSTHIYLYPKKKKRSYIDGLIGFSNDEGGKVKLNGKVDLQLDNVFNSFENINLKWQSSANQSQDLRIKTVFPYVFSSSIGMGSQLSIYRQDSTFVNLNFKQDFFYTLNAKTKIGINGTLISSTFLDEVSNDPQANDYNKQGIGFLYEYLKPSRIDLFQHSIGFSLNTTFLNNKPANQEKNTQYILEGNAFYLHPFGPKHYAYAELDYYNLLSESYLNNELYRSGGINSLRGFNDYSILSNSFISSTLEYRYLPNEELYLSVFTDVGQFKNDIQNTNSFLFGTGVGVHFKSRFGLFSLQYAMGKYPDVPIKFNDSKIHIGVKAVF